MGNLQAQAEEVRALSTRLTANVTEPIDAGRTTLPSRKSRVLARVELGSDPEEAIRLQKQFKLTPTGKPEIEPLAVKLDFWQASRQKARFLSACRTELERQGA